MFRNSKRQHSIGIKWDLLKPRHKDKRCQRLDDVNHYLRGWKLSLHSFEAGKMIWKARFIITRRRFTNVPTKASRIVMLVSLVSAAFAATSKLVTMAAITIRNTICARFRPAHSRVPSPNGIIRCVILPVFLGEYSCRSEYRHELGKLNPLLLRYQRLQNLTLVTCHPPLQLPQLATTSRARSFREMEILRYHDACSMPASRQ